MPRRTTALTYNVLGQVIELFVRGARPTSATFQVFRQYDTDDAAPLFNGAAVLDTPNTTTSAAAGQAQSDPRRIPVTSTAALVGGKRYRLAQNELVEWADVLEVGAGYVRARNPLQNDYALGATFQSTYLTAAVNDAFIQNVNNLSDYVDTAPDYRVRWAILTGAVTVVAYSFFDVVRAVVRHSIEIADIDDAVPGVVATLPVQHRADSGARLIDRAWSSVRADFFRYGISTDIIREDEVIDELVLLRSLRSLAEGGWAPPGMDKTLYLQNATDNYNRFLEQHVAVVMRHATQQREAVARGVPAETRTMPAWSK